MLNLAFFSREYETPQERTVFTHPKVNLFSFRDLGKYCVNHSLMYHTYIKLSWTPNSADLYMSTYKSIAYIFVLRKQIPKLKPCQLICMYTTYMSTYKSIAYISVLRKQISKLKPCQLMGLNPCVIWSATQGGGYKFKMMHFKNKSFCFDRMKPFYFSFLIFSNLTWVSLRECPQKLFGDSCNKIVKTFFVDFPLSKFCPWQ